MRLRALVCVFVFALGSSGCGIVLQSTLGWTTRTEPHRSRVAHEVRVTSNVNGTRVIRRGPNDKEVTLGVAPITDAVSYEQEQTTESPASLGLFAGGAATIGGGLATFLIARGTEKCFADGSCVQTEESSVGLNVLGVALMYLGIQDMAIGVYRLLSGSKDVTTVVDAPEYEYEAVHGDHLASALRVRAPSDGAVDFMLQAKPPPPPPAAPAPPPPPPSPADWVVAVMEVADVNAGSKLAVESAMLRSLRDQIRVFIAQEGVRTVDTGSVDEAMKARIAKLKMKSYESCYDETCQIELGKAMAASHILRANITRFGARCVLNGELVDLRSETTIRAASSRGNCEAEGFLTMSNEMALQLLKTQR